MERSELIRRARSGDPTAQGQLYESMYKRVYYLCLRLVKTPEDAQDTAQETFIAAFGALPGLENPSAFEGWLFQIAANKARNLLRKNGRLVELAEDEEGRTFLDELPDEAEDLIPESALDSAEKRRLILSIIDALPEAQRECVMLFYYSELSVKQIAEVMSCSEGTVKSRLGYARQKIREGILGMEERDGIRLHVFVPIGLLFAKDFDAVTAGLSAAPLVGAGAAASSGSTAAAGSTGAVKTGLLFTLKAKVIAAVTAAAIAVGGGAAIYSQLPKAVVFSDPGMEQNIRLMLQIPEGQPVTRRDVEEIHQIGFIDDGMNIYEAYIDAHGSEHSGWLGDGTLSAVAGTVPVASFEDLALLGTNGHLTVSIVNPTYPVDPAELKESVPYANIVFHDPIKQAAYMNGMENQ